MRYLEFLDHGSSNAVMNTGFCSAPPRPCPPHCQLIVMCYLTSNGKGGPTEPKLRLFEFGEKLLPWSEYFNHSVSNAARSAGFQCSPPYPCPPHCQWIVMYYSTSKHEDGKGVPTDLKLIFWVPLFRIGNDRRSYKKNYECAWLRWCEWLAPQFPLQLERSWFWLRFNILLASASIAILDLSRGLPVVVIFRPRAPVVNKEAVEAATMPLPMPPFLWRLKSVEGLVAAQM